MFDFFRAHQLNIMLGLSSACLCFAFMLSFTRFLDKRRKRILIFMEFVATFLLYFDRLAYIYSGDASSTGYIMVRVSNFFVFLLTPCVVLGFNLYLIDMLTNEGKLKKVPKRLVLVSIASFVEMALVALSQITGLFYYFDESNVYHRGPGFLICYIIPIVAPLIQFTVFQQYRKVLSKWIYTAMVLYIFVPIIMAIIQVFAYGISIVNMAMVLVSIFLYVFTYLDINETVMNAHNHEMKILEEEQESTKRLFDQTTAAFMAAVEQRDEYFRGHSNRVSQMARKIAVMMGKSEKECDEIYYAALLHNVGLVSIPDYIIEKKEMLTEEERKLIEQVPVLSSEILSRIEELPYLKEAALYSHERYDGTGYPVRLKGETIPEVARIVGAVDAYDAMTSRRSYRGPLPLQTVREEFIRQAGIKYDPEVAAIIVRILDQENYAPEHDMPLKLEKEIECVNYGDDYTIGIPIIQEITRISFKIEEKDSGPGIFSEPSILLFDAFDGFVHDNTKSIEAYHYIEYGQIWFDGRTISTGARNLTVQSITQDALEELYGGYEIIAAKFQDHVKLELFSPKGKVDVIVALPDLSKAAYISLTGEHCRIYDIDVHLSEKKIEQGDIPKIVEADSYINRLESDVPNVQIDQYRSATTEAVPLEGNLKLDFHTMSLPSSSLVWHCPYIVLYYSDDKLVDSDSYREYAMIKINGEVSGDEGITENKFSMKKKESFPGWDVWKERHKAGIECSVSFVRKGNTVVISTETLGISIENTTTILDGTKDLYVTLSGDQIALTDIRIS